MESPLDEAVLTRVLTPKTTKYIPYKPTPKQAAFMLVNDVKEVLYGGAASGGKSVGQLMAALQFVDVPGYSAILFRRTYADLALPGALMEMARRWLMPYLQSKEVHWSEKNKMYTFPSGATLSFGYLENEGDCERYQGAEFNYIGIDECTHILPSNYTYMFSRLRKTTDLDVPSRFRATCNPGGRYGDWYYERFFVDKGDRIFIPAGIYDNPYVDTDDYIESLQELDPVTREQLLNGNWQIREAGEMFSREWITEVDEHDLPDHMRIVRCWDTASTEAKSGKGKRKNLDPDYTASVKIGYKAGMYYILDITRNRCKPMETERLIRDCAISDGRRCEIRMEQEPGSSGEMVTDHYKRQVLPEYNFDGIRLTGSKTERASLVSAACQAGKVCILRRCRNKNAFYDEIDSFPYGSHDDMVDAFSDAYNFFANKAKRHAPVGVSKAGGSYWSKERYGRGGF